MMCHSCHGQHWVIRGGQITPCPECGGLGEVHCCDGLVAQPDYSSNFSSPILASPSADETICLLPPSLR
jgi:hypothetical protein